MRLESLWMKEGRLDGTDGRIGAISMLVLFQPFSIFYCTHILLTRQSSVTTTAVNSNLLCRKHAEGNPSGHCSCAIANGICC
ncbi:uncharacterized protein K489DRAFT_91020 [Dissoconium aciculare CBS 342.82]|uniref:Uncharacterized protein n=1 Tax=Dissoconium aciculare CBS 342.82 TaxID=1314786 RepID=A0A6J3LSD4_9PEZI|nr:uncharacterized protein K489DRAFT_91020 [Dissoconium aciculare CBS 342.82]KAF1818543.1 hypothetical protein K489DRAFT_91020 [Dissoconium aciculare CBS 342.82]